MKIESMKQYASLARRTQARFFKKYKMIEHATWGLASEISETFYAVVEDNHTHTLSESGDVMWFIVELCDALKLNPISDKEIEDAFVGMSDHFNSALDCFSDYDSHVHSSVVSLQMFCGKLMSFFQKTHQGHQLDTVAIRHILIDILALLIIVNRGKSIDKLYEIASYNIEKLIKRYPNGFSSERSKHREADDF